MRLILLLMAVTGGAVYGQTGKGSFMIGGSASVANNKSKNYALTGPNFGDGSTTSVTVFPSVGYFFANNLVAGVGLSVSASKYKTVEYITKQRSIEVGPFVRYYFPFGKFAVFPTVAASWTKSKTHVDYTNGTLYDSDSKAKRYRGGVGIAWFVANNVALDGILYYQHQDIDSSTSADDLKTIAFNVGLQFFIPAKSD